MGSIRMPNLNLKMAVVFLLLKGDQDGCARNPFRKIRKMGEYFFIFENVFDNGEAKAPKQGAIWPRFLASVNR
jgi:hypothetical protein